MNRTYVCRNWVPRNEYTTPIQEKLSYRNSGIIKAVTADGEKIQVGRIVYESFENEEFQYIISPFWEIIDTLPSSIFQGIPGIDMELRLEHYYRVNYEPVFITERTPSRNREDLWELLDSVNLDYYDRLEWLIRTNLRAAVDNLIVERAREHHLDRKADDEDELQKFIEEGQFGDRIVVEQLSLLGNGSKACTKTLNRLMHYGIALYIEELNMELNVENYKAFLPVFAAMYQADRKSQRRKQMEGIEAAKAKGVYKGRKPIKMDEALFAEIVQEFQEKKISLEEALKATNMSKSTFYRRIKQM